MIHGTSMDALLTLYRKGRANRSSEQFVKTTGGELRYVDTGGAKPVILMTPDAPCVIEHHDEVIAILSADFRVICLELPGCGYSYPNFGFSFTSGETAIILREFMDRLDIAKAVIAFSCVNALHAMAFAGRYPGRVSHLVLSQIPSFEAMRAWTAQNIPSILQRPVIGQISARVIRTTLSDRWFYLSLPKLSPQREIFSSLSRQSLKGGGCYCLASIAQGALRTPESDFMGASQPALIMFGHKDYSHRQTEFGSIRELLPQAELKGFEECGHFPDLEQPAEYAQQLSDFLNRYGAETSRQ